MVKYLTDIEQFYGIEWGYTGVGTSSDHVQAAFVYQDVKQYLDDKMKGRNQLRKNEVIRTVKKNLWPRSARSAPLLKAEMDRVVESIYGENS